MTCSVPDCDEVAVTSVQISINNLPKRLLPVCQKHADAADEDRILMKGKYDAQCEQVSRDLGMPEMVLLIVVNHNSPGSGFSATLRTDAAPFLFKIPAVLRGVADDIERQNRKNLIQPLPGG